MRRGLLVITLHAVALVGTASAQEVRTGPCGVALLTEVDVAPVTRIPWQAPVARGGETREPAPPPWGVPPWVSPLGYAVGATLVGLVRGGALAALLPPGGWLDRIDPRLLSLALGLLAPLPDPGPRLELLLTPEDLLLGLSPS